MILPSDSARFAGLVLAALAACTTTTRAQESTDEIRFPVDLKPFTLTIVDEQGEPVPGLNVNAAGVRCAEDPGSWYGWPTSNAGSENDLVSNDKGQVTVQYPIKFGMPPDWVTTTTIAFRVRHPNYVASSIEVDVSQPGTEHTVSAGCPVLFSAADENDSPIEEFGVLMAGPGQQAEWTLEDGEVQSRGVPDGAWQTMLVGFRDGRTLFSGILPTRFAKNRPVTIRGVMLRPGLTLSGQLSAEVPRPIEAGKVIAYCLPKPRGDTYGPNDPSLAWRDSVDINPDGSFQFDSLPATGTIQLIAICRGWVIVDQPRDGRGGSQRQGIQINLDEIELADNRFSVDLPMEPAGSLLVKLTKPDGNPLAGAEVHTWPNQIFDKGGSTILGSCFPTRLQIETQIRGKDFDRLAYYRETQKENRFGGITDEAGQVRLYDIPVGHQEGLSISHAEFALKMDGADQARAFASHRYALETSETTTIELQMVPIPK